MNDKQRIFCDEYIKDRNSARAYRVAYPGIKNAGVAKSAGNRLLQKVDLKAYIDEKLDEISSEKVADAREIQEYLTSVLRGESRASVVVVEGTGEGCSEARVIEKPPDEKERTKAAVELARLLGLGKRNDFDVIPVQIVNDIPHGGSE